MPNVFESTRDGQSVFRNEDALKPEFLPPSLPGRETQVNELVECFKPLASGRIARNAFIHGPPGLGKTATARWVLRELSDYTEKIVCIYVNCWQHSTRQAVLAQASAGVGEIMPRRGLATDEVFDRMMSVIHSSKKTPVVVLDELDRLFYEKQENVVYDFLRAEPCFTLVLISNNPNVLSKLDDRTRSSLQAKTIEFPRYTPQELKLILSERSKLAFVEHTCPQEVIALCAAFGAKNNGDARVSIHALWQSGKRAEKRGAEEISLEDARNALREQEKATASQSKRLINLSAGEEKILAALEDGKKTSGELYDALASDLSERAIRDYLNLLEKKKLAESKEINQASGRTREWKKIV